MFLDSIVGRTVNEPQAYRFNISLRFRHPEADLSICSSELGLPASRHWVAGQGRTSPQGRPLEGTWRDSYWTTPMETWPDEKLETALDRIAVLLQRHSVFIARHIASGGSAGLFVGFFLERFNSGFSLPPRLLAQYSALGLTLEFDLHGPDGPPDVG